MIELKNVSKVFRVHTKDPGLWGSVKSVIRRQWKNKAALKDVSLTVPDGSIVGLLGANGAGKTTLIKILTGIIHPTSGQVQVLGFNPWQRKNEYRRKVSLIMGQKAQLWWDLPAADCFLLLQEIYQIPKNEFKNRLEFLSSTLAVENLLTTQIRRLSLGERMKMELVAALLHRPKVIYLDEPTIGLDLTSQRALRNFILQYHQEYKPTIVVTSHYMEDIERLCKRICIIREGQMVYDGQLERLVRQYATHKFINVVFGADEPRKNFEGPQLSDLSEAAEVEMNQGGQLRLRVKRDQVTTVSSALLQSYKVADLSIGEMDVGTIIASIQGGGGVET